jgi:tRNA(Arg) A34 adenosine deaminase TadA
MTAEDTARVTSVSAGAPLPGTRRLLLAALGTLLVGAHTQARECDVCDDGQAGEEDEILQPAKPSAAAYMQIAIDLRERAQRRGELPAGAVLALDNVVLAVGSSHARRRHDPTSHAEIEAIRAACQRHATNDLSGAVLYATSRPCRMCETAAFHARISRIVYGETMIDAGAPRAE